MTPSATADGARDLGAVERIYRSWGHHPRLYAAQDLVTFLGRHRTIRRRAVEAMGVGRGARVLEVACGTGRNFSYVEDAIGPEGTLVGLDYSQEMLDAARGAVARHRWSNIRLVHGDAAELDVGSEPFDGVLCVLGFSAMPGHLAALQRAGLRRIMQWLDPIPFHIWGAHIDRDTVANVKRAGFVDVLEADLSLDVVKRIEGRTPDQASGDERGPRSSGSAS